jgi:hypothetical protein
MALPIDQLLAPPTLLLSDRNDTPAAVSARRGASLASWLLAPRRGHSRCKYGARTQWSAKGQVFNPCLGVVGVRGASSWHHATDFIGLGARERGVPAGSGGCECTTARTSFVTERQLAREPRESLDQLQPMLWHRV